MNEVIIQLNKFLDYAQLGNVDSLKFKETQNELVSINKGNKHQVENIMNYDFKDLFSIFKSSLKIKLSHIDEPKPYIISNGFDKEEAREYIEEMFIAHKIIDIELNIDKDSLKNEIFYIKFNKEFNIKIFFSDKMFLDYIKSLSYKCLENGLYSQNQKTVIVVFDKKILVYNELVLIIGGTSISEINNYLGNKFNANIDINKYKNIVQMRNEQCNWIGCTEWLCPEYLYFDFSMSDFVFDYDIEQYFLKITTDLIIRFIGNYTNTEDEKTYSYINGYKKVRIQYSTSSKYYNTMVYFLFKQYKWAYGGNNSDKLSMLRNLMTIFLCEECESSYYQLILINSEDIYKSVQNNFDIYLKNNVEEYFKETHKVREMVSNKLKEVSNAIDDLITNMNKSFLATIGVILGAAIGYLAKSNIHILKVAAVSYGIFIFLNVCLTAPYYKKRVNNIKEDYEEHIEMFKKIIFSKDMPKYGIKKTVDSFYVYWWIYIIINIVILFVTMIFILKTKYFINIVKTIL